MLCKMLSGIAILTSEKRAGVEVLKVKVALTYIVHIQPITVSDHCHILGLA